MPRRPLLAILACTLLLTLPSIAIGFYADDYVLRNDLTGTAAHSVPIYDLYRFTASTSAGNEALIERGALRWWTAPDLRLHLIRPLASLALALDGELFGANPLGYHLVSIAWYLALVLAVGVLHRRLIAGTAAALATFIFAVDAAHTFPWGWICARHITIAATFSVLSLLALVRAHAESSRLGPWLAALALAAGLSAGETALGGGAFAVAFATLGVPRTVSLRARVALVGPVLCVTALYLVTYVLAGGGASHSGAYISPFSDPGRFVLAATTRLPVMLGDAILGVPAELSTVASSAPFVAIGVTASAAVLVMLRAARPSLGPDPARLITWLLTGAVLSLVGALGGFPGARQRTLADVGFSAAFALLVQHGLARRPRSLPFIGAAILAGVHALLAPIVALGDVVVSARTARKLEAVAGEVARIAVPGDRIFVLAASDPMAGLYPPAVMVATSPAWTRSCWSTASSARATHRVTRTGPASLLIEAEGTTLMKGPFEILYRPASEPMHIGDVVSQCGATYRVADATDGRPSRVELTLDVPFEAPGVHVLAWMDGELRPVRLPAGNGETTELPWSAGPTGLF